MNLVMNSHRTEPEVPPDGTPRLNIEQPTLNPHKPFYILSRVGGVSVIDKTGSGLDDWIYCTLYIHTVRDYR
jgi:hypothetical protein